MARATVEEKILELQNQKREMVDGVVEADPGGLGGLSEEDIAFLLE